MKRIIIFIVPFILLILICVPVCVSAEDNIDFSCHEIYEDIDDILRESDIGVSSEQISDPDISFLISEMKERLSGMTAAPVKLLAAIITVIILSAFVKDALHSSDKDIYGMICVLSSVTVIFPALFEVYGRALGSVGRTGGFITVFVPVFAGVTAAMGNISAAGIYNILILAMSELMVTVTDNYLMPVISIVTVLAISGSIFSDTSLEKLTSLLKKIIVWGMTAIMTLFTGFVTMKCTIAGKADSVATKTVKFALSGFVPIVGGAVSDAYSTVRGSFDIIRTSIGTIGTTALMIIMLPPVIEIMIYRLVMWISSAAAELFSVGPVVKLLNALDCGLAIAQSVLVCFSVMFVLCSGILLNCCSD